MDNYELKTTVMDNSSSKFDLEDRLVDFACMNLDVCDLLPNTKAGQNLNFQLSKSCTATALIYGEVQGAESMADFLHKMKLVLKEIKETRVCLKIIRKKPLIVHEKVEKAFLEATELMAIFLKSIATAKSSRDNPSK